MRLLRVYVYKAHTMKMQPKIMKAVVPQKPMTLASNVLVKFMPKMPAIIAPNPAAKLPMDRVSSKRLTWSTRQAEHGLSMLHPEPTIWLTILILCLQERWYALMDPSRGLCRSLVKIVYIVILVLIHRNSARDDGAYAGLHVLQIAFKHAHSHHVCYSCLLRINEVPI